MIATFALFAALSLTVAGTPVQQQSDAFTADDRRQALEALKSVARAFDEKQPAQQAQSDKKPDKSMADVADKALDFSVKYIGQAASIIEKAAPHVWAVMIRQQYAKAIGEVIGPALWIVMIIILAAVIRFYWRVYPVNVYKLDKEDKPIPNVLLHHASSDDEEVSHLIFTLVLPGIICAIAGGFFIYNLANSVMYLINPEYYAIKDLVAILLHPGTL
jgi:hypothetical protein